jgi:uncharacterized PurR-regulated membrane protein YhhQ (DUF165 family)
MNGFRNNWSRGTNLFWFWLSTALAAGSLIDVFYVYAFKHEVAAFWLTWAFWDRIIKIALFGMLAWMYRGAAKHAGERESALET